ncbi:substrate-binding domain-containing protein [Pyxidicoccus parkwayensis]|uniref:Substrate-binding domain-containing protein n=1 Tax=Pyxidicoccus parkwayensis TaxID=2813578 RepID=A0ABX7NQA5_9BACT|nr:substrate-binding domain-containing protein [Pyxidicoccus parkwaysis]QSQ20623.1 substrate-binding domain-containing protein [Pyxidicoccus parkwaysis]
MKMMKMVMSAAVVAVSVVGCGGQSSAGVPELQSAEQHLGANGELYGSDTLKGAISNAITASGAFILYEGKGSGVGEGCVRTGSTGFCGPKQQALAPMSRDFKTPCQTGEKSNVIALDAVNVFVKATNALGNITTAQAKKLFCGDANGVQGTTYPTGCLSTWGDLNGNPSDTRPLKIYRRDDLSGTTDTFKTLVGCQTAVTDKYAFCSNVLEVKDETSTYSPTCSNTDSATTCIGKLTAADGNAIGYAGDSGIYPPPPATALNKKATVNGIASNETNIRKILETPVPSDVYPLSRKLFLNENASATHPRDPEEDILYAWIYGSGKTQFENILKAQGFIACDPSGPLKCKGTLNDGRGAGTCK